MWLNTPKKNRQSSSSSLLTAITLFGSLGAAGVGVLLTMPGMPPWSWRMAFIFGGIIAVLGLLYRKKMMEPPNVKKAEKRLHDLKVLFKKYSLEIVTGIFCGGLATVPFTIILTFINPVLVSQHLITVHELMKLQTLLILIAIILLLFLGRIADRTQPEKFMMLGCLMLTLLPVPMLMPLEHHHFGWLLIGEIILVVGNEVFLCPLHAFFTQAFDSQFRYRGSAFSFNVGMSLIGGLTPFGAHFIYQLSGSLSMTGFWTSGVALITFVLLQKVLRKRSLKSELLPSAASNT